MQTWLFLMHRDLPQGQVEGDWGAYLHGLRASGRLCGGSEIGAGRCFRRAGDPARLSAELTGYLLVQAASLEDARQCLVGNPVFEAGGSVEIRELPLSDG